MGNDRDKAKDDLRAQIRELRTERTRGLTPIPEDFRRRTAWPEGKGPGDDAARLVNHQRPEAERMAAVERLSETFRTPIYPARLPRVSPKLRREADYAGREVHEEVRDRVRTRLFEAAQAIVGLPARVLGTKGIRRLGQALDRLVTDDLENRDPLALPRPSGPARPDEEAEIHELVERAGLTRTEQRVWFRKYNYGETAVAISARLGISKASARKHLENIRKKLRPLL